METIEIDAKGIMNSQLAPSLKYYRYIKLIARGGFGKVILVEKISSLTKYAMKVIKKSEVL